MQEEIRWQEEGLIRRLKKQDVKAFEEVINTYTNYVGAVVKSRIAASMEPEDVEEVIADVFFTLWKQSNRLDFKKGSIKNYLGMLARNMAINKLRERPATTVIDDNIELMGDDSPEFEVLNKETREALMFELNALKSPDKEVFIKFHLEGETVKQIAAELRLNPNTVKAKLARSRKKLKKQLSERGYCYEN